jgi:DNA-directed RNA polymerase subunit RPC12/RpoP
MTQTHRFPVKCMNCGLHFNVYSWNEDWIEKHSPFCPECGKQKALVLGHEATDTEIFQHVSAIAPLEHSTGT